MDKELKTGIVVIIIFMIITIGYNIWLDWGCGLTGYVHWDKDTIISKSCIE